MLKLIFSFFVATLILCSCNGRNTTFKKYKTVLNQHDLLFSPNQQLKCTPQEYVEIVTDTVLSNNFKVKLKYFSLEEDSIIKRYKLGNTQIKHDYNNFEAILTVTKENNIIVDGLINKALFSKFETPSFWKSAVMQFIWIDYSKTTANTINLNLSFCQTEENNCKDYTLIIHDNGDIYIEPLNLLKSNL